MFPCGNARKMRGTGRSRTLALLNGLRATASPALIVLSGGDTNERRHTRYRVRIANSERAREGHLAVLAEHSTGGQFSMAGREGWEVSPKRPTVGKVKPGTTFY